MDNAMLVAGFWLIVIRDVVSPDRMLALSGATCSPKVVCRVAVRSAAKCSACCYSASLPPSMVTVRSGPE